MKYAITFVLLLMSQLIYPQERGSFGMGFFAACPQNQLDSFGYDNGYGFKMNFLSRPYQIKTNNSFQWGIRMDFSSMSDTSFETVPLNTPRPDVGDLSASNSMFGMFGVARWNYNYGSWQPFIDFLVGYRSFSTNQSIQAQNPSWNPDYESQTTISDVVQTSRFHYGGSAGVAYRVNRWLWLEASATYTLGGEGAIMPLKDVHRSGDILKYPHVQSKTDMLLINGGLRIQFHKLQRSTSTGTTSPSKPKTRDYTPPPPPPPPRKSEPPKKKLEVKPPTKPKKNTEGE